MHGPAGVSKNRSERAHFRRRSGKAVNEKGGVIAPLPQKGSMFSAVKWLWQSKFGHDMRTEVRVLMLYLQEIEGKGN